MTRAAEATADRTDVRRRQLRRVARVLLTVAVVLVIFAGVLPRFADYSGAWALIRAMGPLEIAVVLAASAINVVSYAPLWMLMLPGLGLWRAILLDAVSTAATDAVPAGFTVGVGTQVLMLHSYGYGGAEITRAIALTGLWNNLLKLAMPAVLLPVVVLTGDAPPALAAIAATGAAVLLLAVALLIAALTHGGATQVLARAAQRVATPVARALRQEPPRDWPAQAERFRADSRALLRHRWLWLSVASMGSAMGLFLVLAAALWTFDPTASGTLWLQLLALFATTRLITLVPITPGGVGVTELSYVAGLDVLGLSPEVAAGTVLLFRFLTWFVPIVLGAGAWALYRRDLARGGRRDVTG